jgi:hypothetical protein
MEEGVLDHVPDTMPVEFGGGAPVVDPVDRAESGERKLPLIPP